MEVGDEKHHLLDALVGNRSLQSVLLDWGSALKHVGGIALDVEMSGLVGIGIEHLSLFEDLGSKFILDLW